MLGKRNFSTDKAFHTAYSSFYHADKEPNGMKYDTPHMGLFHVRDSEPRVHPTIKMSYYAV